MGIEEIRMLKSMGGIPKAKKVYVIPKKSAKKIAKEKEEMALVKDGNELVKSVGNKAELNRWFLERRKEMKGVCSNCGGKSCKDNDQYYKFSIAHILPKAYFPSVATHPNNFIELCHFNNSCHQNLDSHMIDIIDLSCFDEVIEKFISIYPNIAEKEKRRIPKILLDYLEVEK
jgi:hypothetical protein